MTVTNKSLNNINVFPTETLYDTFKRTLSNLSANDLQFIRADGTAAAYDIGTITAKVVGTNGYLKLSNGLIIQWGWYPQSNGTGTSGEFSFPITFPNACFSCVGTLFTKEGITPSSIVTNVNTKKDWNRYIWVRVVSTSKFLCGIDDNSSTTNTDANNAVGIIAIGY